MAHTQHMTKHWHHGTRRFLLITVLVIPLYIASAQANGAPAYDYHAYIPQINAIAPLVPTDPQLSVHVDQLTIETYNWQNGLYTVPGDSIYPYPHLNRDWVNAHAPKTYNTIVLENKYVRVIVLPEIGGRIIRWEDRRTGKLLTYANPVVKPAYNWGYRGWWLATGGIEWAFPVEEHGLNEWRPWQYETLSGSGWRGVHVWDLESRTGMTVEVTLRLFAGSSDLVITPRITNPTGTTQSFMFWINAMLTLSGANAPSSALHFWVPTTQMQMHSNGDAGMPGPRAVMSWPRYWYVNSFWRDFSLYSEWHQFMGLFATEWQGAAGAYDEASDQGVVRAYPPAIAQGVKLFCLGGIGSAQYTDDNSRYFEFWGGYNHSFFREDAATISAGQAIAWDEHWYPASGISGLNWANAEMAAALRVTSNGIVAGLYAPAALQAHLILRHNGTPVAEWDVSAGPDSPFHVVYPGNGSGWELQIWQNGALVTQVQP